MRGMTSPGIDALAERAASMWLREASLVELPPPRFITPDELKEKKRGLRERAEVLRRVVKQRDWLNVRDTDALGPSKGRIHFRFLELAFPFLSKSERAYCLKLAWCRARTQCSRQL